MTRAAAMAEIICLARGLPCDDAGVRKLAERIAASDNHEALRAALVETGGRAVLEGLDSGGAA